MSGWAADADALDQPITVRLYLGGAFVAQVPTTDPRPDVAARMHGVGQNTGWHATITPKQIWNAASGTVMCAYAINVGAGQNNSSAVVTSQSHPLRTRTTRAGTSSR